MEIDSDNVILDNIWAWRADHGQVPVGWTVNVGVEGLVVNGDNVTALGLAVEHYEAAQVQWNGEGGETIFYQSEMPYDVPSQSAWMDGSIDGYASYNVSPSVTTHQAYGLGVYSFFNQGVNIVANSGILAPVANGVKFTDSVSVFLSGSGQINYNIASDSSTADNAGTVADSASYISYITSWGGTGGNCAAVPTVPGTPSAMAASSITINLTWSASTAGSACTVSYSVFRSATSGFTPSSSNMIASSLTAASYSDTGLTPTTTYYYIVEAMDGDGISAASGQASGTTESGGGGCSAVPSAPAGLTATATSSSAIGLNWSAVTPPAGCSISSYSVYGSTTSGFTAGSGNLIAGGVTSTSYSETGLSASTTYYYVVEAVDADGSSAPSAQESATTQAAASGTSIVSINAGGPAESNSGGGDSSFVADEDYSTGGTTYSVANTITIPASVATTAAPAAVYQSARQGTVTYTISGLAAGTSYTVRLHFAELYFSAAGDRVFNVAINGTTVLTNFDIYATAKANYTAVVEQFTATANSSGQIVIAFTNGTIDQPMINGVEVLGSSTSCSAVPSAPAGLTATASSSSAIGLSWTAVTPPANCTISSYSVYRSTTSGFTPSSSNLIASEVTSTSYSNAGLAASTTYYYVVEAIDADGTSAASAQASATTSAASCTSVPSAPAGLTATASSSSAIGLSWTAVTPPANCTISSYSVYGSTTSGFTPSSANLIASGVTTTTYTNTGLAASTTHYYKVEAVDTDGSSAASTQASATTQAAGGSSEVVAIACGGPAESNSGGGDDSFVADEDFSGGGANSPVTAAINLTQPGANAAPMGVYQHGRAGIVTYTIPGLTAGSTYTVLLHFAETYFTAAGDREFNVAINGTTVLTNLDIYGTVGKDAALLETFNTTANSSGQIVIAFTAGAANQPVAMGIEIRTN
jgi:fibronectin type 3 domain-containing protein